MHMDWYKLNFTYVHMLFVGLFFATGIYITMMKSLFQNLITSSSISMYINHGNAS